jgi:hypothetical protein
MYEEAIAIEPRDIEPYYKVGELLELKAPARAAEVHAFTYSRVRHTKHAHAHFALTCAQMGDCELIPQHYQC